MELKRCATCKDVWYCGAECQKAGWKRHKKTCAPPLPFDPTVGEVLKAADAAKDVLATHMKIAVAHEAGDWWGVLKWEGRVEKLLVAQPDDVCDALLLIFVNAHVRTLGGVGIDVSSHQHSIIKMEKLRVEFLGKMQRFRDQGEALCTIGDHFFDLASEQEASRYYLRARRVAEAHGFFSVECNACIGLAQLANSEKEKLELLRNALAASALSEEEADVFKSELIVLHFLIGALLTKDALLKIRRQLTGDSLDETALDEMELLVPRFRKAAKEQSRRFGRLSNWEFTSLLVSAKLHEVLCVCPCGVGNPFSLVGPCISRRPVAFLPCSTAPK